MGRRLLVFAAALALATPAWAQGHDASGAPAGQTRSMQEANPREFVNNPFIHQFYDLSVATLGAGAPKPDVDAYEQKSYAIFRAFGDAMGMGAAAMQDHLKLIPRQVVQIVGEDPHVLDSFDSFTEALIGPQ